MGVKSAMYALFQEGSRCSLNQLGLLPARHGAATQFPVEFLSSPCCLCGSYAFLLPFPDHSVLLHVSTHSMSLFPSSTFLPTCK